MDGKTIISSTTRPVEVMPAVAAMVLLSILTAYIPTEAAGQAVEDSAAIRSRVETYLEAWNAHDASGLGRLFTEDSDFVMGNQPAARGPQEIQGWWRTYFLRQEPERRLELDVASLRFPAPDVAIMSVTTTTGGRDSQGQDLMARRFRGSWLWQRQSEGWLVSAMRGLPLEEDSVVLNASVEATETLRPDIRGFVAEYEDALNTQDPRAVGAFYRDDAEIIVRNSPLVSGRSAIDSWWRAYFNESRPYRALLILDEVRMIAPNIALLNITATGAVPQWADGGTPVRYARATWIITREGSQWRIAQLLVLPSEDDRIVRNSGGLN